MCRVGPRGLRPAIIVRQGPAGLAAPIARTRGGLGVRSVLGVLSVRPEGPECPECPDAGRDAAGAGGRGWRLRRSWGERQADRKLRAWIGNQIQAWIGNQAPGGSETRDVSVDQKPGIGGGSETKNDLWIGNRGPGSETGEPWIRNRGPVDQKPGARGSETSAGNPHKGTPPAPPPPPLPLPPILPQVRRPHSCAASRIAYKGM